jgi:hypothetical protein
MIILDDNGQYANQSGDGWQLVSMPKRFRTMGEKRNAAAALVSADVDAYVVWDDDDLYLPHALSSHAAALQQAPWSVASKVLIERKRGRTRPQKTGGLFHPAWAYRRDIFKQVSGYPFMQSGQDQGLARRFRRAGVPQADPTAEGEPYLIYRWSATGSWHLSAMERKTGYDRLAVHRHHGPPIKTIRPEWPREYCNLSPNENLAATRSSMISEND